MAAISDVVGAPDSVREPVNVPPVKGKRVAVCVSTYVFEVN